MANAEAQIAVSEKTIESFHAMWDNFPHTVLLVRKSREIIASNQKAKRRGFEVGLKCFEKAGKSEIHAGCQGNKALETGDAQRWTTLDRSTGQIMDAYWLPVPTGEGLMLHFAVYVDIPKDEIANSEGVVTIDQNVKK